MSRRPLAALAFLQAASYGVFAPSLGFYLDDWDFLERVSTAARAGFWRGLAAWAPASLDLVRPLDRLYFYVGFALGGSEPLLYHAWLQALQLLEAILLFRLLDRLLGWRRLALTAAALALCFPNRDISRVWFSNSVQTAAQVLTLASFLAHERWLATRRRAWLAAGLGLFAAGYFLYESCLFMPLLLGAGLLARRRLAGESLARSARGALRDAAPYAVLILACAASSLAAPSPKLLGFSWAHAARLAMTGAQCLSGWAFQNCAGSARELLRDFSWAAAAAWAGVSLGAAAWLSGGREPAPSDAGRRGEAAVCLAAAAFLAAYLPYAFAPLYIPNVSGVMSRVNGAAAWAGGLAWAAVACRLSLRRPRLATLFLAGLFGLFTCANWHALGQYRRSWESQREILARLGPRARALPASSFVLLADYPAYRGMAAVFDAPWDFAPALRLSTGRPDLRGDVVSPRPSFGPEGLPARGLYLYRFSADTLEPLKGPPLPELPAPPREANYQRIAWL